MDASKDFDRVNHWTLFKKMIDSGMPPIFVRLIVTGYCEQHACAGRLNNNLHNHYTRNQNEFYISGTKHAFAKQCINISCPIL